jgi:hypothetical protein
MIEELRDIEGYEGRYQVSNLGRVRSLARVLRNTGSYNGLARIPGRILSDGQVRSGKSYTTVGLAKEGVSKTFMIHRIVAMHFIPNPNGLPEVNHLDGNKRNNHYANLEWTTRSGNMKHAFRHGLVKIDNAINARRLKIIAQRSSLTPVE